MTELEGVAQYELLRWKNDTVTQAYLAFLQEQVNEAKRNWLAGAFRSSDGHVDAQLNSAGLANAETLNKMALWIEDIKLEDEEQTDASEE